MNDVQTMFDAAWKQHQAGNIRQAELLYRQILHIEPRNGRAPCTCSAFSPDRRAERSCHCLHQRGRAAQARFCRCSLQSGFHLHEAGDVDKAAASCQNALRVKPDFAEVHNSLGLIWKQQGKHGQTLASFHEAVRLKPDFFDAWSNLGDIYWAMGNVNNSFASLQRALSLRLT